MGRARTCPVCGKPVPPRPADRFWPFCSDRCRLVDLGEWLGEGYRIPGDEAAEREGREEPGEEGEKP